MGKKITQNYLFPHFFIAKKNRLLYTETVYFIFNQILIDYFVKVFLGFSNFFF